MKRNLGILLMKRIVFLFSIVLMLCSCKSFEDHSNEKAVGTYKNGYILNLNKEIVATYRNGYVFSEKALGTPNDYGLGLEQDIYTTGKIDTLMLKSKYFDFKRKVFVYLPPFYPYFDANDFDVVYTTDAQTMEQFFMTCAWPLFQNKYKWFIVVGICSPQTETYSRQDDFLPNDSATIKSYNGHGGHSEKLMDFVKYELIPYIRSHYRTTERSLGVGHSLGASFMMQCLMNDNPFTDYFFLSPNLTFGNDRLMLASQFCNYKFDVNKRCYLFFSDAGEERLSHGWRAWKPAREMVYHYLDTQQLPSNIVWKRKSYLNYNHLTSFPMALHDAYQGYFDYIDSIKSLAPNDTTTLSKQVYRKHIEIVVKDAKQEVYITGNQKSLGMWNPGLIKLKHINDSIRAIDIDLHLPALFKFTLGSWKYEAGFENSYYGDNLEINNTERKNYRYILTEWMNIEDDENQ